MSYFGIPIRNGLPIGLGSVAPLASGGGSPFSPLSLFSGGAPGAWYDPSDYSTLFQDSAGTTPVTAVEQPVRLMLDKSQGLVLGPKIVDDNFNSGTSGWISYTNTAETSAVSTANGNLVVTTQRSDGSSGAKKPLTGLTAGKWYKATARIKKTTDPSANLATANLHFVNGDATVGWVASFSATSTSFVAATIYFSPTGTTGTLGLVSGGTAATTSTYVMEYDDVVVQELAGNHAFQVTNGSEPRLSARYNLLTKTEDFSDAVWLLASGLRAFGSGSIANTTETTDPLGGNTADKLVEISGAITSAGLGLAASSVPASSGVQYTATVYAKAAGRRYAALFANGVPSGAGAYFDLQDGVVTTIGANNLARSIVSAGNGWWKLSITFLTTTGAAGFSFNLSENGTTNTYTGNGTSGIYIWGASLVPSNQSTLPYQRVNTATDYNTTGFLPYLRFDGVDDSLSTNSISFTATDKMSVFAGVRKLSDATSIFAELSATIDSNSGTFHIANVSGTPSSWQFASKGTIAVTIRNSGDNAPITNTLTGLGNISGDLATLRLNGAQVAQSTADQGTGNYGNYPLYIGRRGGTSLPFNGQMYSMIIVGKAVTAGELSSTETYVNQKTGAY